MSENQNSESSDDAVVVGVTDGAYTLVVADFADTATAWSAYEALEAAEDGRTVEIEGVVVVKRDADGKLEIQKATDHSTRSGLKWGVVGGIALGVIFPPSILGSAAALGAAGAATGQGTPAAPPQRARRRARGRRSHRVTPGSSRSCPIPAGWRSARRSRRPTPSSSAQSIDVAARDIKAAAKEAADQDAAAESTHT